MLNFSATAPAPASEYDFRELCLPLQTELINYARKLAKGNAQRAADVVQDSLLKAFQAWPRWHPEGDPAAAARAWMYRIVCNTFMKSYHHNAIRAVAQRDRWHDVVSGAHGNEAAINSKYSRSGQHGGTNGELGATRRFFMSTGVTMPSATDLEFCDEVIAVVAELSPDHRAVIERYYLGEMTCEAIAEDLGIPKNTVFTRLARARAALGIALKDFARREYGYSVASRDRAAAPLARAGEASAEPIEGPEGDASGVHGVVGGLDDGTFTEA